MKLLTSILGALALLLSTGCVSIKLGDEYAAFIRKVPAATITDISTTTQSPLWNFKASASGISTDSKTGVMTITNGKADFGIPLWGFSKQFSVSGLVLQATPEQLEAAAKLTVVAAPPPAAK